MKLDMFYQEYGENFPDRDELIPVVQEMDEAIAYALDGLDLSRIKSPLVRAVRTDLARHWLTTDYGFPRSVDSFKELCRAEIYYVQSVFRATIARPNGLPNVLHQLGWLPTPTRTTINRIVAHGEIKPITERRMRERWA